MRRPAYPWISVAALVVSACAILLLRPSASPQLSSIPAASLPDPPPQLRTPPPASPAPGIAPLPGGTPRSSTAAAISAPLLAWADRYLVALDDSARRALLPDGLTLARERRPLLADLIRTDPEAALAAAIPRPLRAQLPAEIVAELEQLVSARADLAVIQSCLHPPGAAHDPADDLYRATVIDGREYRAHVYGSRLHDASLPATSLIGIAIDRDLAVSDSRHRILDADEPHPDLASSAGSLAVEANGKVTVLPSPDALPAFAAALLASEQNPVVNEADSGAGSSTVTGRPTQAWTHGDKDLLVIRVDFSDLAGTPINKFDGNAQITPSYIDDVINGANGVRAFLQQSSYGKTDILFNSATDVTPVLRVPNTAASYASAGDSTLLHTHARAAAVAAGVVVDSYHRVAVVFSYLGDLAGSKLTYAGLANVTGANLWVNGSFDLRVVGHELGHNYGLRHSNLWKVTDGNPVSLTTGSSLDYGDPFDLMGDGDFFENDFSHWNKSLLQWIPDTAVTVATGGGTYRVYRFDASAADLTAPRALKIVRDSTRDHWIGYRRGLASTATDNGAYVLWGYNTVTQGALLDLVTPGTSVADAPLPLNTTFNDSAAGISLRPVAQGGSGADEWLDVQVTFQPRIQWVATSYVANEQGGSVTLSAARSANSTGNVTVSYATAPGTATSPADYTHTAGTLSWLDGDTSAKTIVVPLVADALVEGTETFTVTLSSPVGGVVVDPASATVTLADPGAHDPTFAANFINNAINRAVVQPDGKILIAGAFSQLRNKDLAIVSTGRISRLDTQGLVDPDFAPGTGANGTIHALARQPDGKILVGGNFTSFNGTARGRVARIDAAGNLDTSFAAGSGASGTVRALVIQPDGKVVIGGDFTSYNGTSREYLARLNADGSVDTTFVGPDFGSSSGWRVESLALQPDGKLLVGGVFYFSGSPFRASLCRVSTTGALDAGFNGVTNGAHLSGDTSSLRSVLDIVVEPAGTILIGGDFTAFNSVARSRIARLSSTGALISDYDPSCDGEVVALLRLPNGNTAVAGEFTSVGGQAANHIAILTSAGALDASFAAAGGHPEPVRALALQSDGLLVYGCELPTDVEFITTERPIWRIFPGLSGTPGVLQFSADAYPAVEGSSATLNVTRTGGSLGALTIGYSTVAGSATAGSDYTATSGTLTWSDGDSAAKTITVPLALDASVDTPETFLVNLGAPLLGGALLADRQQATVTLATAFAHWQAGYFTSAELADSAVSGDAADPDGDGLNNLAEFALGRVPRTSDAASAWTTAVQDVGGTDYLTITFRRRTPALDLSYAVQTSGDLTGAWTTNAVQVGSAIANGDGTETVTYRDAVATGSATRRFLRVHVARTP